MLYRCEVRARSNNRDGIKSRQPCSRGMVLKRLVSFVWSVVKLVVAVMLLVRLVSYMMRNRKQKRDVPVS